MNSIAGQIVEAYPVEFPEHSDDSPRISDSLHAICHEHRYKNASFDPFPHAKTLNASRGILHLMGIVISRPNYSKHHAWMVLNETNLSDAIDMTFGKPVKGLRSALNKMPAIMLQKTTYQRLAGLISDHRAMKIFSHVDEITKGLIDTLHQLPEELRMASVIKHIRVEDEARILELACSPDDGPFGSRSRSRFGSRLSDCRSRKSFWNTVQEELFERFVHLPKAAIFEHPKITAVTTVGGIIKIADQFQNCVRMLIDETVCGELAFFIFDDGERKALISVKPKFTSNGLTGQIDEMKGVKNSAIPPETAKEIEAIFAKVGITRRNPDQDTQFGVMSRYIRDLKSLAHPADIQRAAAKLEEAIYAST